MPRRLTCESAMRMIRFAMDRDESGWLTTSFLCPVCRDYHDLVSDDKQLGMGSDPVNQGIHPQKRGLPPVKRGAPEGWCIWHETASPQLSAPCAWETCSVPVHVHRDALGAVKSGRSEKGYMVERCPKCHRYNAVFPTFGGKPGIRTMKLQGNEPVLQMKMARMG